MKRIEAYGIRIGKMTKGPLNKITDVKGVKVGHGTLKDSRHQTGVTLIMPCEKNVFTDPLIAASHVINGFGKTSGLVQIDELGRLESPIALCNTLAVGAVYDGLVRQMLDRCSIEGVPLKSFSPLVCECNDSYLNAIDDLCLGKPHLDLALEDLKEAFEEGAVGAGRGMICHQLKGGIGSASRIISLGESTYTLGVLTLTNHGLLEDLRLDTDPIGLRILKERKANIKVKTEDKGSVIVIIATDLPLTDRQLKRICKRAGVGLARTGGYIGHGSGEIVVAFSTANQVSRTNPPIIRTFKMLEEGQLNLAFRAAAEATEEAVLNSMVMAEGVRSVVDKDFYCETLKTYLEKQI